MQTGILITHTDTVHTYIQNTSSNEKPTYKRQGTENGQKMDRKCTENGQKTDRKRMDTLT